MSKEQRKAEDLPEPPPDYPRSYRKPITKGEYKGRILCLICKAAVVPQKIDRHENGESKVHKHNLAKRYAKEQQKRCEQELEREGERQRQRELELEREKERQRQRELELERERERQRQRELELERERERQRQIEAERKRDAEALDRELELQNSIDEAMEISSTSSSSSSSSPSSSSSSSSDDDSDVQFVPPPSEPLNGQATSREKPAKPKGISLCKGDGMWRARISVAGKNRYIGSFKSPEAAATAYQVVRNELKESGLPPTDSRRNAVFDSAKEKANSDARKMEPGFAPPATPERTVEGATTSSENTPSGTTVPSDRHFTGAPGTVRCMETTSRGRPCQYCAVPESRFCNLHSFASAGRKRKRKQEPSTDDWAKSNSPGSTVAAESPRQQKKARRAEPKSDLQEVAAENLGLTLPKKPKVAINSFMHYRIEQAAELAASNPQASLSTKSRIIGDKWHKLSSEEKARYETMANKSKVEYEKAYARYQVELEEFKRAHPEWQFECDRIGREHAEAALKALDEHIATQTVPPNGSSLGRSSDDYLRSPEKPAPILNISPSENIIEGLKNGSIRLEPKNEIILENVELVMATREDEERKKSTSSYRRGNIGLRCIHCKSLSRSERKKQGLVFPRDILCFSNSFSNFRPHFRLCQNISGELRAKIENPPDFSSPPNNYVPAQSYCQAAATILGIEDDPNGTVRFSIDVLRGEEPISFLIKPDVRSVSAKVTDSIHASIPLLTQDNWQRDHTSEQLPTLECKYCKKSFTTSGGLKYHLDHSVCRKSRECAPNTDTKVMPTALERAIHIAGADPSPLIFPPERQRDTTDLIYLVINHFVICNLTRAEQTNGQRCHMPLGLAGLKCKHCSKSFYFGSAKDFSYRFNERLTSHLQSCTSLPSEIRNALSSAKAACTMQISQRCLSPEQHNAFKMKVYERLMLRCIYNGNIEPSNRSLPTHRLMKSSCASSNIASNDVGISSNSAFWEELDNANGRKEAEALFSSSQRQTTTDFNYLVIRQFSLCHRSSQEQRSRYPIGYPGLCCTHCQSKMYFPDSTSFMKQFSQKVYDHLKRCSRAPQTLSIALAQALDRRDDQKQALGAQGSLTSFCDRVLGRMLEDAKTSPIGQATPSTSSRSKKSQVRRARINRPHEDTSEEPFVDAPVLLEMDRPLATEHHFELLSHFGIGELTENAQAANSSLANFPIGQPGLRCRHCKSKTFYYERLANMKSKCVGQLRDHIKKGCRSVPKDVRQCFAAEYNHSAMQRQLSNVEGGSLDKMFQRLWLRLHHDFTRRKEIDAISRVTPLLEDYDSVDSFFTSSSDDDGDSDDDDDCDMGEERELLVGEKEASI